MIDVQLEGWDHLNVVRLVRALRVVTGGGLKDAFQHVLNFSEDGQDALMGCFSPDVDTAKSFAQEAYLSGVRSVRISSVEVARP